jgi:clan AA aspartic protease
MGIVHTEIILKNAGDVAIARRGIIPEKEVRVVAVNALVDTGAGTLVINEEICQRLGLAIEKLRESTLADGSKKIFKVSEPVKILWEDRDTTCPALVAPDADTILLGAIPLEDLDLMVDPVRQRLVGAHGDKVLTMLKHAG